MRIILICFLLTLISNLFAQLPDTDIFLFDIKCTGKTISIISHKNITNRKGYDNQPFFHPEKPLLYYVSIKEDNQADIYFYDLNKKTHQQFTKTAISEYSPQLSPDKKLITCVVVEIDSTQKIYGYEISGKTNGKALLEEDSIGYYSWISIDSLIYYKLTQPHSLHVIDLKNNKSSWIANHPARSFKAIDETKFFYCVKEQDTTHIRFYSTLLKKSDLIGYTGKLNEDFIWQEPFGLLKTENQKIYRFDTGFELWVEVLDLSKLISKKISRFAISKDKKHLAVVVHNE
jgi:hypothetical protein